MDPIELAALSCMVCFEKYDTDEHAPCVASCGHSICSICYDKIKPKCPTCWTTSFSTKMKNFQLMDLITQLQEAVDGADLPLADPKMCGSCSQKTNDDLCYTCISCSICVKAASVDGFLAKASKNRFCEDCKHVLKAPHQPGRLVDVQMAVKSKLFATTVEFGNSSNVLLEMDYAVNEAKTSLNMIEKQFPFGKRASGCCSDEDLEEIEASARVSLQKAVTTVREGITAIYTMAEKLGEVSNSLSRLPNVVNVNPLDNKFLAKIQFPEKESSFFDEKMMLQLDTKRTGHKWALNSYNDSGRCSPFSPNSSSESGPSTSSSPPLDRSQCKAETRAVFLKDMIEFFTNK